MKSLSVQRQVWTPRRSADESRYSDVKQVDGVLSSDCNEDYGLNANKLLSVNQVTERVWNPKFASELFKRDYTAPS
jgi:hypothetical protein